MNHRLSGLLTVADQVAMLITRVLDGQAPDVEIITNGDNNVNNEASVDTDTHAEHQEHESHLVDITTQSTGPTVTSLLQEDRAQRVDDAKNKRKAKNIPEGESEVDQVSGNNSTDAVGIDEASKERKGDEMVGADARLEGKISGDHGPDAEEWDESEQGVARAVALGAASTNDVEGGLDGVENTDDGALG